MPAQIKRIVRNITGDEIEVFEITPVEEAVAEDGSKVMIKGTPQIVSEDYLKANLADTQAQIVRLQGVAANTQSLIDDIQPMKQVLKTQNAQLSV